jgi:hypothetical protein
MRFAKSNLAVLKIALIAAAGISFAPALAGQPSGDGSPSPANQSGKNEAPNVAGPTTQSDAKATAGATIDYTQGQLGAERATLLSEFDAALHEKQERLKVLYRGPLAPHKEEIRHLRKAISDAPIKRTAVQRISDADLTDLMKQMDMRNALRQKEILASAKLRDAKFGTASRASQTAILALKGAGIVDSGEVIGWYRDGIPDPEYSEQLEPTGYVALANIRFTFETQAGLIRRHDGSLRLFKKDGLWRPQVEGVDIDGQAYNGNCEGTLFKIRVELDRACENLPSWSLGIRDNNLVLVPSSDPQQ